MSTRLLRRLSVLCCVLGLAACARGAAQAKAETCTRSSDCSGGTSVCINQACVPTCHAQADCGGGLVCEQGICLAPACGNDQQCQSGQVCLGGACSSRPAASQVASCEVTPSPAVVHAGGTVQLTAVLLDAEGKALRFTDIAWSASGSSATVDAVTGVVTGAGAGDTTVTATVNGKSCTSVVHGYAAASSGLRVTVINLDSKEPVQGAKVVLDAASAALVTGSDGTVSTQATAGPHDVHVFAGGYNYTSYIQTTATDLLVPLAPWVASAQRSGFAGHMCDDVSDDPACTPAEEFSQLTENGQAVHLAFFGSAIPNSLLDLSVDTLVGPMHSVNLSIPGGPAKPLNLPYGLVLGIGSNFFGDATRSPKVPGTNDYRTYAEPGVRALWGIGGNLSLEEVLGVITPLLSGSGGANVDVGSILPQVLGFFNRLEAGALVGVQAPPNGPSPTFASQTVQLTTPMRLRLAATSPNLPQSNGVTMDGVVAVVGAMDYPVGFVPLGMTAGISAKDGHGGVLDPTCDTSRGTAACDTNALPLQFAAENGGTEGSKIGVALLAANFGAISPGSTASVAVSGQVKVLDKVDYVAPPGAAPAVTVPPFLSLPASASLALSKSKRTLAIGGTPDARLQVYRFELENAARLNWNVWMSPGAAPVALPNPAAFDPSLVDPFADALGEDGKVAGPRARLLALQFTDSAQSAASLESFPSAVHLDELGTSLQAFTAVGLPVGP